MFFRAKILIFTLLFTGMPLLGAAQAALLNRMCAVMPGHKAKQKFFADYQGKRYYFCCRPCVKAFKKNPEKFGANPAIVSPSGM